MKQYLKTYITFFGYGETDFMESELSGNRAVNVHHIDCKGMGGSRLKDTIENLMALTFTEHMQYGDKKHYMLFLYTKHIRFIKRHRPDYAIVWDNIPLAY